MEPFFKAALTSSTIHFIGSEDIAAFVLAIIGGEYLIFRPSWHREQSNIRVLIFQLQWQAEKTVPE